MKHWWIHLIALFLLMGTLSACIEEGMQPRSPTPGVPHFTIATFNAHLKRAEDPETVRAIGAIGADIICLQETNEAWERAITENYGDEYPYILFHHEGASSSGLGIISKYPIEDFGVIDPFKESHPGWLLLAETPMGKVQMLNLHLRAPYNKHDGVPGLFAVEEDHRKEIRYFTAPLTLSSEANLPTIVLGDFNSGPEDSPVNYLEGNGFTNALPLFHPGQETWRHERSLMGQSIATLDHILFDESFAPLNAYVLYRGNSDHLPVVAHLEQRARP